MFTARPSLEWFFHATSIGTGLLDPLVFRPPSQRRPITAFKVQQHRISKGVLTPCFTLGRRLSRTCMCTARSLELQGHRKLVLWMAGKRLDTAFSRFSPNLTNAISYSILFSCAAHSAITGASLHESYKQVSQSFAPWVSTDSGRTTQHAQLDIPFIPKRCDHSGGRLLCNLLRYSFQGPQVIGNTSRRGLGHCGVARPLSLSQWM